MDDSLLEVFKSDPYAASLGVEIVLVEDGHSIARMPVREDHVNFNGGIHGGVIFSLADVAFSLASNSWGMKAAAINVTVDFLTAPGDTPYLEAEVRQTGRGGRAVHYSMEVRNAAGVAVAMLSGWVYQTNREILGQD
ncbi:MAG: PaaI family thioesterase [Candidatus Geothermincolia bacterium]